VTTGKASWRLPHAESVSLLVWPDGAVMYDARQSVTRLLSPGAGACISALKARDLSSSEMPAQFPDTDGSLAETEDILLDLERFGIISRST